MCSMFVVSRWMSILFSYNPIGIIVDPMSGWCLCLKLGISGGPFIYQGAVNGV